MSVPVRVRYPVLLLLETKVWVRVPSGVLMKKKIAPKWVLQEVVDLIDQGVDVHDWEIVNDFLEGQSRFTMLDWIRHNRSLFTYCVMSKQYDHIEFYHGPK